MRAAALAALLGLGLAACGGGTDLGLLEDPNRGPQDPIENRPVDKELAAPTLAPMPLATPLDTVAVAGHADGTRVIIQGGVNPVVVELLPDGTFCLDVALNPGASHELTIYAQDTQGNLSQPSTAQVAQSSSAALPEEASATCGGGKICAGAEICGNLADDDCNGKTDSADAACEGQCHDDVLEENDGPQFSPIVPEGAYPALELCPGDDDWYVFDRQPGQAISVDIRFSNAVADIDLALFDQAAAMAFDRANPGATPPVAKSDGTVDTEALTYTIPADKGGRYYLRVFTFQTGRENRYDMTVR